MAISYRLSSVKRALAGETNWTYRNDGGRRGKLRFSRQEYEAQQRQSCPWPNERPPGGGLISPERRRMDQSGRAGHSERPVQEPRVKLAPNFAAPAAASNVSSETSKENASSCAFITISVMTRILLLVLFQLDRRSQDFIRDVHAKVMSTSVRRQNGPISLARALSRGS